MRHEQPGGRHLQTVAIRPATAFDAESVAGIYNHYVLNSVVTFEEDAISAADMAGRIAEVRSDALPWLVAERRDHVVGYAYASKWKGRCAYRFSVESTVYLAPGASGHGLGSQLYAALLAQLKANGLHAVMGGIALPNAASIALHEKFGMIQVAHFKEVGFKFGQWIDVGYWQRLL
jgi:L-amino acid N-acyltransferase YncA